ncbi:MAG: hypothetical protein RL662_1538 [Bacteroidota bacterium]|jgi:glycosyltransferase involved in cell wall biosynthesis
MNILINLIPIKKGGGQQVASNFILQLQQYEDVNPIYLVSKGTYIHEELKKDTRNIINVVDNSYISRFLFQIYTLKQITKKYNIDIIYTMFGPGLHVKNIKSVTGCAYSNIFFPEINFWKGYSFIRRAYLKLVDNYRLKSTLKSDFIIFENESMLKRANTLFHFPLNKMTLILPSISEYPPLDVRDSLSKYLRRIDPSNFNILMFTGWHKNKNITMIPLILKALHDRGVNDVKFIITISKDDINSKNIHTQAVELGVDKSIHFIDMIKPYEVPILFDHIDAIMLLSLLESFSNNIIEAWSFRKALFISDEEWAKAICKDAAIYVQRSNALDISSKIIDYRTNVKQQVALEDAAKNILIKYPNPKEKVSLQIEFLKQVYQK